MFAISLIQIAYSRSNPGFRGMQSWKVRQISSYVASSLSSSKGVANDLFFGKAEKIKHKGMIKRRKIFHTNYSFLAFGSNP